MSTGGQPSIEDANTVPGNPVSQNPAEQSTAKKAEQENSGNNATPTSVRDPRNPDESTTGEDGQNAPLMQGERDSELVGEEARGATEEDTGRFRELEGEQMSAPGEGDVARTVKKTTGLEK